MDKTIYIVTTRSFNQNTMFNNENCIAIDFDINKKWYEYAFPQYFTDIIQFVDIQKLEECLLAKVESELENSLTSTVDSLIWNNLNGEVQIRLEKAENRVENIRKKIEEVKDNVPDTSGILNVEYTERPENELYIAEVRDREYKIREGADTLRDLDLDKHYLSVKEKMGEPNDLIRSMVFEVWNLISGMRVDELNELIELVVKRNLSKKGKRKTGEKTLSEKIVDAVVEKLLKQIICKYIPYWWPKLHYYKNKCLYWKSEEAKDCYDFLKQTTLFEDAAKKYSMEVKNQFSLDRLIYKYQTDAEDEEWYIVRCFDMRTDPDFGLNYILSLIREIDDQLANKEDNYRFNILIHDYDIGRKLILSSVLLKKGEYKYETILKNIQKSLSEKELNNMIGCKEKLKPSVSDANNFFSDMQIEQPKIRLEEYKTAYFKIYSELINYLEEPECKEAFDRIVNIIVFKHNKGEIAEILKSKHNCLLRFQLLHMQNIIELRNKLVISIDNYIYGKIQLKDLEEVIKEMKDVIKKALDYLNSVNDLNNIYNKDRSFLMNMETNLQKNDLNKGIDVCIELLKNISRYEI